LSATQDTTGFSRVEFQFLPNQPVDVVLRYHRL
jgi:hypothetical protein